MRFFIDCFSLIWKHSLDAQTGVPASETDWKRHYTPPEKYPLTFPRATEIEHCHEMSEGFIKVQVNPLSANPAKWSNTLKLFVGNSSRFV